MLSSKWVVLWSLWAARLVRQPTAPVRVSSGLLRGSVAHDGSHAAYLGIPYATVNRFQAPGPEPSWVGIFEADREHVRCLQRMDIKTNIFSGQEDCLTLNVYTPLTTTHRIPVMVFIHGGAFVEGSGSPALFGPKNLVSKGVLLVTINYRLNIQGLLNLGIKEAPGNAAMKDQVAALKWIQRNIKAFGGDPDNVTLFGESAGAASVSYHLISPMSKGLFHKAIMQSGSSLAPWAYNPAPFQTAATLAKVMGYETEDPQELYKIFSEKTDIELVTPRIPREHGGTIFSEFLASPCIEKTIESVEAFLTEEPYKLLVKGEFTKMPLMIGTNSEEGYLLTSFENDTMLSNMDFSIALPNNLEFPSEEKRLEAGCKLKQMYMGNDTISKKTLHKLSQFYAEPFFVYPSIKETELILKNTDQPVFSYIFDYAGWKNICKWQAGFGFAPGATHADEIFYLFQQHLLPNMFEWRMIEKISTLWTNFAKFGLLAMRISKWWQRARQLTAPLRVRGGLVRGSVAKDGSHARYLGIPYATVTPERRFQAPGPEPSWNGIFEAIDGNVICAQCPVLPTGTLPGRPAGQEDCLKINVFTPASPTENLPVMVFIHGGGFIEGSGMPLVYGPNYLVPKGVILVTFNYRLNVSGYLNLGIKEVPGNAGMKDQVAALRWVQKNIHSFGGDPGNVTIFGESAGGSSVSYHLLSPMSKGLFQKAITQSGSSLCPWAFQSDPEQMAHRVAKTFGCDTKDPYELLNFFNRKYKDVIMTKVLRDEGTLLFSSLLYAPSVEKQFDGVEPFLTEEPYGLLSKGHYTKVPMIIGTTDEEGYFFVGAEKHFSPKINGKIEISLPSNLEFPTEAEKQRIGKEVREMYMGDESVSNKNSATLKLSKFYGDPFMTYPSLAETELILKTSDRPVYNYCFKYSGWRNLGKVFAGLNFLSRPGATHVDELFYLFHQPFLSWLAKFDKKMIEKMTTLWTNFAMYGDPTPSTSELVPQRWLPTNPADPRSFVLDRHHATVPLWFKDSLKYWRELYSKYRKK